VTGLVTPLSRIQSIHDITFQYQLVLELSKKKWGSSPPFPSPPLGNEVDGVGVEPELRQLEHCLAFDHIKQVTKGSSVKCSVGLNTVADLNPSYTRISSGVH